MHDRFGSLNRSFPSPERDPASEAGRQEQPFAPQPPGVGGEQFAALTQGGDGRITADFGDEPARREAAPPSGDREEPTPGRTELDAEAFR